jgi:hypothetical protein
MFCFGRLIAVLPSVAALAACGVLPGEKHLEKNTMTKQQASDRIEQIIRDTVAKLDPKPQLSAIDYLSQPTTCIDPTDGGSSDRTVLTRHYLLRGIPHDRNGAIGQQVKRYWENSGYKISSSVRLDTNEPQTTGFTQQDQFSISLTTGGDGSLGIGATSPCIWPNGTPEPSST